MKEVDVFCPKCKSLVDMYLSGGMPDRITWICSYCSHRFHTNDNCEIIEKEKIT